MASLNLQSTYKMNSGYEIPVLGFGVRILPIPCCVLCQRDSLLAHADINGELQVYQTSVLTPLP